MQNNIEIHSDGVCLYLDTKTNLGIGAKIGVILLTITAFIPFVFMVSFVETENVKEIILGLIAYLVIVGGITLRFALWQLFGEESISMSLKSIKYHRSYGVFTTNDNIIELNNPAIAFNKRNEKKDGTELGNIHFIDYDALDQYNLVFESTNNITLEQFENICVILDTIVYNQQVKSEEITSASLN
jgi:hypothetical protein